MPEETSRDMMNSRPSRTYTQPQAVLGAQQTEGTGLRKDLSLEVLLTEPSLAAQIPINLQTPNPNPPVDGDVLHHLLSVCILQRDAPWRHCQNHLLKLASSNPCLAVEKKKNTSNLCKPGKGFHLIPFAGRSPTDSVEYHSFGYLLQRLLL